MYLHMHKGELLTLDIRRNRVRIRCRSGKLWITQQGDSRDYLLGLGQELEFCQRGKLVITALEESQCLPDRNAGKISFHPLPART